MRLEETLAWYSWHTSAASARKYYSSSMQALGTLDKATLDSLMHWYGCQVFLANPNLLPRAMRTLHNRRKSYTVETNNKQTH